MPKPTPLKEGSPAPVFTFQEGGESFTIGKLDGPLLVYFYPKDDTPGCTKQACGIRDAWPKFKQVGLRVVGISKDDETSHQKFQEKHGLPFPLFPDTELTVANGFGVFGEKSFMGKIYESVHRVSFLVDADGTILKTYLKVKPDEHAETVLNDMAALSQ